MNTIRKNFEKAVAEQCSKKPVDSIRVSSRLYDTLCGEDRMGNSKEPPLAIMGIPLRIMGGQDGRKIDGGTITSSDESIGFGRFQIVYQTGEIQGVVFTYLKEPSVAPVAPKEGRKDDADKSRYDLLPVYALNRVVKVLGFGAKKYGDNNWKLVPDSEKRYIAAAMRHIEKYRAGQENDFESGLPHLAHAICCLMFLIDQPGVPQSAEEDREMHGRD